MHWYVPHKLADTSKYTTTPTYPASNLQLQPNIHGRNLLMHTRLNTKTSRTFGHCATLRRH